MENSEKTHQTELDALRRTMGTMPDQNIENSKTEMHIGVSGITVEMFDYPRNPYRVIFEGAVATWGTETYETKWPLVSPENRFKVVKAALSGQTLPQAVEPVQFFFIARGASRSSFDQHARQRLATFFSQGVRDNSRLAAGFRLPTELYPENGGDPELFKEIADYVMTYKRLYKKILQQGHGSFQSARCLMPMGMTHHYKWSVNLGALKSYMAQRLQACEQSDTVQVAIAAWDQINARFPLIASYLKPGCDHAKRCTYHQISTLGECFGCLFAGCGRWPDPKPYATFNKSCSSYEQMAAESGIKFPRPSDWVDYERFEDLCASDVALLRADK